MRTAKIEITCGTGGVGKTTVSAALAVRAALAGKKTLVITIDPAKRLANALGLEALADHPTNLTPLLNQELTRELGVEGKIEGELHALIPDARSNLKDLFETAAPNPEAARRITENPIFRILGTEFSGASEYMAMQKLFTLYSQGGFDLIVVDTPPSRNALSFLSAPKLLERFFDEQWLKTILGASNSILATGFGKTLGLLEKVTGSSFITQLVEFAASLFEIQGEFVKRLETVHNLLHSEDAVFTLVTTPHVGALPEARHLSSELKSRGFRFGGVVLNRTLSSFPVTDGDRRIADEEEANGFPARKKNLAWIETLQAREKKVEELLLDSLHRSDGKNFNFKRLGELPEDAHSMSDLLTLARNL